MLVSFDHVPISSRITHINPAALDANGNINPSFANPKNDPDMIVYIQQLFNPRAIELGIYACGFNFDWAIEGILANPEDRYSWCIVPYIDSTSPPDELGWDKSRNLNAFGVADNLDQIKTYYAEPIADPVRTFVIGANTLHKHEQEPLGGWRWHKWGEYIGTHTPQCEYLYDEPIIEQVVVFNIYEIKLP